MGDKNRNVKISTDSLKFKYNWFFFYDFYIYFCIVMQKAHPLVSSKGSTLTIMAHL